MNNKELLKLATNQALEYCEKMPNTNIHILFDGNTEYTVVPETHLEMIKKAEPNLKPVAIYFNGKKV